MKKLLLFLCLLSACKKPSNNAERLSTTTTSGPEITSVKFFPVYSGANESVAFDVKIVADSNIVSKMDLYLSPNSLRWEILNPSTGTYRVYDHVADYPTYEDGYWYYFSFVEKDGTVIKEKSFQVY